MIRERIMYNIQYIREFGMECWTSVRMASLYSYVKHKNKLSWVLLQNKHRAVLKRLKREYSTTHKRMDTAEEIVYDKDCIWTAWLQGENVAPDVIRLTLASMRKNANGHPIIVLTENTIHNYISIPEEIDRKYKAGIISKAHYSDIVRIMVLAKYGGLWLDATMLTVKPVSEQIFTKEFYSLRFENPHNGYVTDGKWVLGIIGGKKGSESIIEISDLLCKYWLSHKLCIDYFVFDYLIALHYRKNTRFHEVIDSMESSEAEYHLLRKVVNDPYDDKTMKQLISKNHFFYLPHRGDYTDETGDGRLTFYGYLAREYLKSNSKM